MTARILILGGSRFQVPLIRRARERGLYAITCDYLPDNPGHQLADEYHNVSTTDKDAVLALARRIGIDAVASFSSDPAMPAVAYVAEALGLPGPPLAAIVKLTEKDAFRRLMSDIGLLTPRHYVFDAHSAVSTDDVAAKLVASGVSHLVKPVDSSGSRGVTVLEPGSDDLAAALRHALQHSRAGRCIVEEYIEGVQIEGDGFLKHGRLVHYYVGDQSSFTKSRNSIPVMTCWPTRHGEAVLRDLVAQVEAVARASGFVEGPVNIEARVTPAGEVFIVEMGPRNGGNYIPILQCHLTGFDFVSRALDSALGVPPQVEPPGAPRGVGAVYVLHSDRDGTFAGLHVSDEIKSRIILLEVFRQIGQPVCQYRGSNTSLGVALLRFESVAERDSLMADLRSHLLPLIR